MSSPTQSRFIFAAIAIVAAVGAAVFVYTRRSAPATPLADGGVASQTSAPPAVSTSPVTSTVVADLGSEWRIVRQNVLSESDSWLSGMKVQRETLVQLKDGTTQLMLTENNISNSGDLNASLAGKNVRRTTVAGREGYIVPTGGLVSASAFALVGKSTVLLIEYGDVRWGNLMEWPNTLEPQVVSAIQRLRAP